MNNSSLTQTLAQKRVGPNKLVLGFLVAAVTAIMGTAGVAGATSSHGASGGIGYGGNVNVDLNVSGNNNTITVIVRYIFGG